MEKKTYTEAQYKAYKMNLLLNSPITRAQFDSTVSMLLKEIEELRSEVRRLEQEISQPAAISNDEIDSLFESLI